MIIFRLSPNKSIIWVSKSGFINAGNGGALQNGDETRCNNKMAAKSHTKPVTWSIKKTCSMVEMWLHSFYYPITLLYGWARVDLSMMKMGALFKMATKLQYNGIAFPLITKYNIDLCLTSETHRFRKQIWTYETLSI